MNSGSVWESLSQLIFRDITYRIYVGDLSWIWMCFIKQIKWNYQQTNTLNSVGSKVKGGWVGVGLGHHFGNRRARSRNLGSMKWYFLKQKKSKFRNRVNLENSWTLRWPPHFFRKKHSISESGFLHNLTLIGVVVIARLWLLDRLGHKWLNIDQPLMMCFGQV